MLPLKYVSQSSSVLNGFCVLSPDDVAWLGWMELPVLSTDHDR